MSVATLALVTGGAGFIGSHLIEALLDEGYRVRVVDNLATGHLSNLAHLEGRFEWIDGDLADFAVCRRAAEGVDLFAASSSAYGNTVELPKREQMLPEPLSPYAAGKLASEYYVKVYAQTMGLDGVSLRYFNIFGPRQDPSSPYSGVISIFIKCMSRGQRPTIFGDGEQTRDFTYVANVVAANLAAMRHPEPLAGEVFNVGVGERIRLLDLVAALNSILGADLQPEFQPSRPGDVRDSLASLDRIAQILKYRPIVPFQEGLRRTVAFEASRDPRE
jgi:UDP-glucose 4-epimerase